MRLAREMGMEVEEGFYTLYDVYTADEAFLTGTAAEVGPVVRGRPAQHRRRHARSDHQGPASPGSATTPGSRDRGLPGWLAGTSGCSRRS